MTHSGLGIAMKEEDNEAGWVRRGYELSRPSCVLGREVSFMRRVRWGEMKRIFMLTCPTLFSQGVEAVLRQSSDVEIVGHEADVDTALARIKELRPDVVIVDNGLAARTDWTLVMRILQEQTGAKIVGLSLHDNSFSIYRGEQRELFSIEDLTREIERDDHPTLSRKENEESAIQSERTGAIHSIQSVREDKDEQ
jgi:chemotaxis response regulator CheB